MSDWSVWDWFWWLSAFVVIPVITFTVNQWRTHRVYRDMRKHIERIGKSE